MPWTCNRATGTLSDPDGAVVASDGYPGADQGRNNSAMQDVQTVQNVGPIPEGRYRIGHARHSARTGEISMDLSPEAGTQVHGRSAFTRARQIFDAQAKRQAGLIESRCS